MKDRAERLAAHNERGKPSSCGPIWANSNAEDNPPSFPLQSVYSFDGHQCDDISHHQEAAFRK